MGPNTRCCFLPGLFQISGIITYTRKNQITWHLQLNKKLERSKPANPATHSDISEITSSSESCVSWTLNKQTRKISKYPLMQSMLCDKLFTLRVETISSTNSWLNLIKEKNTSKRTKREHLPRLWCSNSILIPKNNPNFLKRLFEDSKLNSFWEKLKTLHLIDSQRSYLSDSKIKAQKH